MGIYAWTLQTYLRLKADRFPCELVKQLPEEGIVLVHRNALRAHDRLKPNRILLICLKADGIPYPYAQLHVVQNPLDKSPRSYYLPHWTQPSLVPRHPERGDRFETIAFFGHEDNLATELQHPDWEKQLHRFGFNWQPILNRNHWNSDRFIDNRSNDYSQVDAVVAVRRFNCRQHHRQYINKPATKLYNAWLAKVPALMGCESAYQAERRSELDYLEVSSVDELLLALKRLQNDLELRRAMVNNGQIRAQAVHPSKVTAQWRSFLSDVAVPAYYRWRNQSSWTQHLSLERSALVFNISRVQRKVRSFFPH